jgi:hypothetical protein
VPLFWILLHFAVACVTYFFLAYPDGDRDLAVAGVLAFAMMYTLAAAELFG